METETHLWTIATAAMTSIAVSLGLVRIGPVWDVLAERQMGEMASRFKRLSLSEEKLRLYLRVWGVVWVTTVVGLWFFASAPPLAIFMGLIVYVAPRYILDHLLRKRARLLRDQLVGSAVALANSVRAGLSVAQGLETVAQETPQPLKAELDRTVFEYEHGRPLKEALDAMRTRLKLEEFTLFALAIDVALDRGGRLNEALERICNSLREKQRLERKLAACTAAGRQAVIFLGLAPIGLLGMFRAFGSSYIDVSFNTFLGQIMLAVAGTLLYLGVRWAWKIVNFEF